MENFKGRIISFKNSVNNGGYAVFYKPNSNGYTSDLNEAGEYSCREGLEIQKNTHGEDIWLPDSTLLNKAKRVLLLSQIKPLDEAEEFAAKLYGWLLKSDLCEDFFDAWGAMDGQPYCGYEIVNKPSGGRQDFAHDFSNEKGEEAETPEEFKYIDHEYCDQHSVGMEGDSWEGRLYFPLPNGQYLKCPYSC